MLRVLSRIQQDAQDYNRQQKGKPGQSRANMKTRQPKTYQNKTMEHIMKQKTEGKPWNEARQKLLAQSKRAQELKRPKYIQGPRPRDLQKKRKKPCKNCPG